MIGFKGRKNAKNENVEVDEITSEDEVVKVSSNDKKVKKKKDSMSAILAESVPEAVLEDFRQNSIGVVEKDGSSVYVGMLLKAEDIGGINKKSKKDEAKGAMVECINSGRIKTLITSDLMDKEELVIIPDVETLDAMEEFTMLTDAPFRLAFVDETGHVTSTDHLINYDTMVDVVSSDYGMNDLLIDVGVDWVKTDGDELSDDDIELVVDSDSIFDEVVDDMPFGEVTVDEEIDETSIVDNEEEFVEDVIYDDDLSEDVDDVDIIDDEIEDVIVDNEEEVIINSEDLTDTIIRKFYSDELGLEVSTDVFDSQFIHGNKFVGFEENVGDSWLDNYINQKARDANVELKKLHNDNLFKARENYYSLLSLCVEKIQRDLDISNDSTDFGKLSVITAEKRIYDLNDLPKRVAEAKSEIKENFEANLAQVGIDAANAAKKQYRERYGREFEEKLSKVESRLSADIESKYQHDIRELNETRKKEALTLLDYSITETLREVSTMYLKDLDKESERYRELSDEIKAFVDENRKEDIAHTQAEAERLAQSDKAEAVRAEYMDKLESRNKEYEASLLRQREELEANQRLYNQAIELKEAECDKRIRDLEKRLMDEKEANDKLVNKFIELDAAKDIENKSRLEEMNVMNKNIVNTYKSNNVVRNSLLIIAVVATLAIGIIVGMRWGAAEISDNTSTELSETFNSRMDSIEESLNDREESEKSEGTTIETVPSEDDTTESDVE